MSHIRLITNEDLSHMSIELYELLGKTDALISDYSSVYIDYLLTNQPIGFTVDDLKDYSSNLGFSVENPIDYMPGEKITTVLELQNFIYNLNTGNDTWKEERERIKNLFHHYQDNQSSKRIYDLFFNYK